ADAIVEQRQLDSQLTQRAPDLGGRLLAAPDRFGAARRYRFHRIWFQYDTIFVFYVFETVSKVSAKGLHVDRSLSALVPRDPSRQAHAGAALRGRVPLLRRRIHHQCRAPLDSPRPVLLAAGPAVGPPRLPADLRRIHAARWPRP